MTPPPPLLTPYRLAFSALSLVCATAQAQALTPRELADCQAIPAATQRLACYDALAQAAAPAMPVASAPAAREAAAAASSAPPSVLDERWELTEALRKPAFLPQPYRPVYLLPLSQVTRLNQRPRSPTPGRQVEEDLQLKHLESQFQLSLKARLWSQDDDGPLSLWAAYTQSSRWQVYNEATSRPFRETNYEPELLATLRANVPLAGGRVRFLGLALNHQSNGRSLPFSRSWNRVIGDITWEGDNSSLSLRPWVRLREAPDQDDNPDIADYMGRGEVQWVRRFGGHVLSLTARHSLHSGERSRGSALLEWSFVLGGGLHGYAQLFRGWGDNMVDYNVRQTRLGLGVSLVQWR
ncbi:phospholipase A [Roseateles sp. BYS180W]|uniref:Phospholipase A1 n=1 Tax=Roseateles rivi TaxID=3299028 RepID=A0ABW7FQP0_9BURK